jgi:hypothetical protein
LKKIAEIASRKKEIQKQSGDLTWQQLAIVQGANETESQLMKEMIAHEIDLD